MKKLLAFALITLFTASTAVFAQDSKMQDAPKTRKEKKAAMKADKMTHDGKMSDDKMMNDKMSDGKMKDDKMSDGKMKDDKMKPKNR